MVTNDGDIFYVYDTSESNRSFGEKLLHKVSASHCLHNGSFYWCAIDKTDNKICFASVPLKRDNNTRKVSVAEQFILTTERVA